MDTAYDQFRDKVTRILASQGIRQKEVAKAVGCSSEHLNAVLKGRTKPSSNLMEGVATYLNMNLAELLTGAPAVAENRTPYGQPSTTQIPFLESKTTDGRTNIRTSTVDAPITFRTDWLYQLGNPDQMAFVRTMGTSLDGEIPDGSLVLIDMSQTTVVPGSPYFLRLDGELKIRRVAYREDAVVAYSDRTSSKDFDRLPETGWQIIGRCLWYSKILN